jgi:hypothetical protein
MMVKRHTFILSNHEHILPFIKKQTTMKISIKIFSNTFFAFLFFALFSSHNSQAQTQGAKEFMYVFVDGGLREYGVTVSSTTGIYEKYDFKSTSLKGKSDFTPVLNIIKKYTNEGWNLIQFTQTTPGMFFTAYILSK